MRQLAERATPETAVPDALDEVRLLTAERLAALLGISTRTLWRLRSAGRLPRPIKLGGSVRWRGDVVRRWIERGCPPQKEWEAYSG